MNNIRKLVIKSLKSKTNKQIKLVLMPVKKPIADKIKQLSGLDVTGYDFIIDNYAIKHIIAEHGNNKEEKKRGQIPITLDKFELIPEILNNPDFIVDLGKSKIGRRIFLLAKNINNKLYYVEEMRTKRKELAMVTFYIAKKTKKRLIK